MYKYKVIYLDNHATTPCDPHVVDCMAPYFTSLYGNPSSGHYFGQESDDAIKVAIKQVNTLIKGDYGDLIITSGATESNNLAILGVTKSFKPGSGKSRKIVTTLIEHKSVLAPIASLAEEGWKVEFIPVGPTGRIDIGEAKKIIGEDTFLVSLQLANSEIGSIQPLAEIAAIAISSGTFTHCDASQAIGKIDIDVEALGIDFLSISAHKFYGPKGIGALWIKQGLKHSLRPIMFGGGSPGSLRPGTLPVPLIIGLGSACELINIEEAIKIGQLRNLFENLLLKRIPGIIINGNRDHRLPNNSNLTFPDVDAEMLLANLPGLIASTGSACESGSIEPSRVLIAIGLTGDAAYSTIRIGIGRFNTESEIIAAADQISDAYNRLNELLGDC
jgi:cysteine desulfurase